MSNDYFNPPNSVWPNGLKRDDEGYVNFYTSGTNKVDISTITWPEGTEVKSPFVYQDDKLVGFVDTKALDIDNNNTTIDINYTHFDADLDSIMENTLTINAPANAAVNVKYGAVDKVLTEKIEKLIGKEKCEVKFDKDSNKVTFVFPLDATGEQIGKAAILVDRVLPANLVADGKWANGLPITYTPVEYLESTGTQHIRSGINAAANIGTYAIFTQEDDTDFNHVLSTHNFYTPHVNNIVGVLAGRYGNNGREKPVRFTFPGIGIKITASTNWLNSKKICVDDECIDVSEAWTGDISGELILFNFNSPSVTLGLHGRIYSAKISEGTEIVCNFIPALNETGTPGMYDTVNKVFKTNLGSGDFLYPTDAAPAVSAGLDETFYAKLTKHGVRRLYHVPKGCTMTKDEYAAANGFKELVEPPMPLEGYWRPEWRETETQLICDWVETEAPTEEVETLNNEY